MEEKDKKKEKEEVKEEVKEEKVEEVKEEGKEEKTPAKKKMNPFVLGVLLALVVVAVVSICGILFLNPNKEQDGGKKTTKSSQRSKEYLSDYRISGNSIEDFDLYFLQLENDNNNMIYSPLSIKYALKMLSDGSKGDTKNQIDAVIGDYKARNYPNNDHMSFANAMFIRNTFKEAVREEYTNKLKNEYGADIVFDEFSNANTINNWISDKTFKLINSLVDDETVSESNFFLVNALAIDMQWNQLLQCESGASLKCISYGVHYKHEKYSDYVPEIYGRYPDMNFNGLEKVKSVQLGASFNRYDIIRELGEANIRKIVGDAYREWLESDEAKRMDENSAKYGYPGVEHDVDKFLDGYVKELDSNYEQEDISTEFELYVDDNVKVFGKDLQTYDGMTLQYVAVMPRNVSLVEYVRGLNAKDLTATMNKLKALQLKNFKNGVVTKVFGNIPLFNYEYELDLMNDLKSLGIEDVFDINKADLSEMLEDEKQYISSASHKANIEFSNEGIKAAAATAMGGKGSTSGGFDYLFDVPVEEIDITFDQPYLYVIRDKDTGEVWFVGTVYEPTLN